MIIGVLSDAHGNFEGFMSGLRTLEKNQADSILFLGDAIGYIPDPDVLHHLMKTGIPFVKGNHEAHFLSGNVSQEKELVYQFESLRPKLDSDHLRFIKELPIRFDWQDGNLRIQGVHGSLADPTYGYVYPDSELEPIASDRKEVVLMGNTHHPFVRNVDNTLFVNVGSCGLPRDESGLGCVALVDTKNHSASLIKFSIENAARKVLSEFNLHDSVKRHLLRAITQ